MSGRLCGDVGGRRVGGGTRAGGEGEWVEGEASTQGGSREESSGGGLRCHQLREL